MVLSRLSVIIFSFSSSGKSRTREYSSWFVIPKPKKSFNTIYMGQQKVLNVTYTMVKCLESIQ